MNDGLNGFLYSGDFVFMKNCLSLGKPSLGLRLPTSVVWTLDNNLQSILVLALSLCDIEPTNFDVNF